MKSKIFITALFLTFMVNFHANATIDWSKFNKTEEKPKVENSDKTTLDAPLDNRVYLGLLFGLGLVYVGIRKYRKSKA